MGRRLGYAPGRLPVTEGISRRLLRLPFFYELEKRELERVVASVYEFFSVPPDG
jgi:dTDP-4-amino-4,6-dideoxygalactose transaminase